MKWIREKVQHSHKMEQFDSAIFLIQQYGIATVSQTQALCNTTYFSCGTVAGEYHVTNIIFKDLATFTNVGTPNALLTSFTFPALVEISISFAASPQVANPGLNILDYVKQIKSLVTVSIKSDFSFTSIPSDFTDMPLLKSLELSKTAITQVPSSFFTNSPKLQFIYLYLSVNSITIDNTINLPSLTNFYMGSYCQNPIACNINFTTQSFPKLSSILIQHYAGSITINHNLNVSISTFSCIGVLNSQCNIVFGYPQKLVSITATGMGSNISPFPVTGDIYQSLTYFEMSLTGIGIYPIATSYPPKLGSLILNSNKISSVPSIPLPPTMNTLSYYNNSITDLDADTLFSSSVSLTTFNMMENPAFDDTITQAYCKGSLKATDTSITNLPDCLWCYYNYTVNFITTSVPSPINFVCDYSVYTPINELYISNQGKFTVVGRNIGFANFKPSNYSLTTIIGNEAIQVTLTNPPLVPTNLTVQWAPVFDAVNNNNPPKSILAVLEAGINLFVMEKTKSSGFVSLRLYILRFNPNINHTWVLDNSLVCTASPPAGGYINVVCPTSSNTPGPYSLKVENQYSISQTLDFTIPYPVVATVSPIPFYQGSVVSMIGYYGPSFASGASVTIAYGVGDQPVICQVQSITLYSLVFIAPLPLIQEAILINVTVDQLTAQYARYLTVQESCQQSTSNCHGNGQCNTTGQCVCNSNAFYNNCSKPYPTISSASYNTTNNKVISINGDFGPYGQSNTIIKINNTLDCTVNSTSQQLIICELDQTPNYGLSSVQLQLDSLDTNAKDILYLRQPDNGGNNGTTTTASSTTTSTSGGTTPDTPQQQCEKQTSNCYGHGNCDMNGVCQCQYNYNPDDNCFTKFINTTITPNTTSPTVSFDIDGIDFQFEVVSIQELDFDSNIIKELFISNYTWITNMTTNNISTIVDYQLNTTLKDNSTTNINDILLESVNVSSTISFSTQPRDIQFGDQQLHINANSIKLSVNVTNWQYSLNLATLRVLNMIAMKKRVIKDDIQFNGRFIDVALSDGRPTYSQTQLISLTQSSSNEDESIALIGINLPQCQSCVLHPDFSPLLIDKSNDSGCEKSNNWRIIVGCVVGGVAALAITTASIITYKKIKKRNAYDDNLSNKLKNSSRS
ncbi:hypothetical protein DFA_09617 [Cavenderia fasciculata]|uniref:ComC supersandwich domain-containing protein n=1 Tax=Cavenderia fasciculata TaxID=261658 RepID=F4Q846_CACFS|nr:uncharacterized protein DFA_09617 [Cavenderia fasciculata]EGG15946.1 hypothetical protein DFA_09617 [Cavenderia fasciculata]|eukprot:XP_004352271.1 hypothetical protein DFA_09617 [Cavenderia fasciculata]